MTKQDLKTGMIAVARGGNTYLVLKELGCLSREYGFTKLDDIREDLTYMGDSEFDIVEVYDVSNNPSSLSTILAKKGSLIWKRAKAKELTVSEIEKLLGYPVKIVKE